jgi:hypothetical protein
MRTETRNELRRQILHDKSVEERMALLKTLAIQSLEKRMTLQNSRLARLQKELEYLSVAIEKVRRDELTVSDMTELLDIGVVDKALGIVDPSEPSKEDYA